MKVAIVSESPADEAVIGVFLNALTGTENEIISSGRIRPGGWAAAINAIEVELKHVHYNTDGHALVAIVDSDDSPVHDATHEMPGSAVERCRICAIRQRITRVQAALRPRAVDYRVRVAVGLAVPALEAWLLCGSNPHIVEAPFERATLAGNSLAAARRKLKIQLYGKASPSLSAETEIGVTAASRLAIDLSVLENAFPKGFGRFAQEVRGWRVR